MKFIQMDAFSDPDVHVLATQSGGDGSGTLTDQIEANKVHRPAEKKRLFEHTSSITGPLSNVSVLTNDILDLFYAIGTCNIEKFLKGVLALGAYSGQIWDKGQCYRQSTLSKAVNIGFAEAIAFYLLSGENPFVIGFETSTYSSTPWDDALTRYNPENMSTVYILRMLDVPSYPGNPIPPTQLSYAVVQKVKRHIDAPINEHTTNDMTALMFAAEMNFLFGIIWLIEHRGASLKPMNEKGYNAIAYSMLRLETELRAEQPDRKNIGISLFVLKDIFIFRYNQDPSPFAYHFPKAMQKLSEFAYKHCQPIEYKAGDHLFETEDICPSLYAEALGLLAMLDDIVQAIPGLGESSC